MGRPRYTIQPEDILHVVDYLLSATDDVDYVIRTPGRSEFRRYLETVSASDDDREGDARILNRWCETCLNGEQWAKLKVSIRKRRYQAKVTTDIQITLSKEAHEALLALKALSHSRTLSETMLWAKSLLG